MELTRFKNLPLRGSKYFSSQEQVLIGERKDEGSPKMACNTYLNRYDIQLFFRFGKQKRLLYAYQTPELQHEEYWWKFERWADVQLYWLGNLPIYWERYPAEYKDALQKMGLEKTPSQTYGRFAIRLEVVGTPT